MASAGIRGAILLMALWVSSCAVKQGGLICVKGHEYYAIPALGLAVLLDDAGKPIRCTGGNK